MQMLLFTVASVFAHYTNVDIKIESLPHDDLSTEWGNLSITLDVVDSVSAIEHIALHGSGHTEMIITEDETQAIFLNRVDSVRATTFHVFADIPV